MIPLRAASLSADESAGATNRAVPGWLISVVLHALLLGTLFISANRKGLPEASGEAFHDVGLVAKESLSQSESAAATNAETDATATESSADSAIPEITVPSAPTSIPLDLPSIPTIGAGPALPMQLPSAAQGPSRATAGSPLRSSGGGLGSRFGSPNGTSFFQIASQGDHFYYVVDCSGSMDSENAIGVARAELMASIERLDPGKQFQVLFYDSDLHPLIYGKRNIFFATDINKTLARQFINSRQPDSGTFHRPALLEALRSAPDVIYFLTDGDTPELSHRDLQDLRGENRKNTTIHVIQFGSGPKLGPTNWLELLARQHEGSYRYRDITAFRQE